MTRAAPATVALLAACLGIAGSLVVHAPSLTVGACLAGVVVLGSEARLRLLVLVALVGWSWGSARVDALARSTLESRIGSGGSASAVLVAPPRVGSFELRAIARIDRFDGEPVSERVLLELPLTARAPPQGARIQVLGTLRAPRGPRAGFDERTWLRRQGVHVVLRAKEWRVVGRRTGLGATPDRLHGWLARGLAGRGEGRAVAAGVLLGDDAGLSPDLRDAFRASGLYHVLAVSGQNVAVVAGAALGLCWLLGIPRLAAHGLALVAIGAYVLAVGAQPSVVRAGVAAALGSLAFLTGAVRDRWHALVLAALVLLAWNPWNALDPGCQLSFAAVVAIFTLAPRLDAWLSGYPLPRRVRQLVAISCACTLATAPITWLQFHRLSVVAVPANLLAAAAVAPLLVAALAAAALSFVAPGAAHGLGLVASGLGSYLALCARVAAALPGAQITTMRGLAAAAAVTSATVCLLRWRRSSGPST